MRFRTVAIITALVTFVLGVGYLFAGALVVSRWQIKPTDSVLLLGRRIGALYFGLSIIFFAARSATVSATRTALCAGATVACSLLAILGAYEFAAGRTGPSEKFGAAFGFTAAPGQAFCSARRSRLSLHSLISAYLSPSARRQPLLPQRLVHCARLHQLTAALPVRRLTCCSGPAAFCAELDIVRRASGISGIRRAIDRISQSRSGI